MRTAYRCRAYPDEAQQEVLTRTFGCVRVVWNRRMAERQRLWHAEGKSLSYPASDRALTQLKKDPELAFLREVSSVPLQQALRHQHAAFQAFYSKRARYPRFKSRRGRQSAHYTRSAFSMCGGVLRLAKTDTPLRFAWSWPKVDLTRLDPLMVIVSREPDGRWYLTFTIDAADPAPLPGVGHVVGVDLGVKDFAVTSDGECVPNPRHLERRARNLARYQRRTARCQKGSANRNKAVAKVARAHRKVRCARTDFLHRASTQLVRGNDIVVSRQLEYKCQRYGRELIVIDRWYPSSKTCSACGHVLAQLSLSVRTWRCPSCGNRHGRDYNAAKNILAAGLAVARSHPGDACGAGVRHPWTSRGAAGGETGTPSREGRNPVLRGAE